MAKRIIFSSPKAVNLFSVETSMLHFWGQLWSWSRQLFPASRLSHAVLDQVIPPACHSKWLQSCPFLWDSNWPSICARWASSSPASSWSEGKGAGEWICARACLAESTAFGARVHIYIYVCIFLRMYMPIHIHTYVSHKQTHTPSA